MSPIAQYVGLFGSAGRLVGLLALAGACAAGGGLIVGTVKDAEIDRLQARHAAAWAEAERSARERLQSAQAHGDRLTTQLHQANAAALRLQENVDAALARVTAGRPCLREPALRLLHAAPGLAVAGLPAATGRAAADDAPAATDTDLAHWIARAGRQYEECRARLGALVQWHHPEIAVTGPQPTP